MMVRWSFICLLLVSVFAGNAAATTRFALIVGNNQGEDKRESLQYATRDARKMYQLLTELGRFKKENTVLLLDASAREFWRSLNELESKSEIARNAGEETLLLVYYSGHAGQDALELGNTLVKYRELKQFLERSKTGTRLAFVDSCHSGQLIASKGAKKGKAFHIKVSDEISSSGYAIITSSARNELSQESRELRGAFFTHHLASALRGKGDTSGDGRITLQEAYEYAYARTLAQTSTAEGGSQHPMYHFQLKGRGEIVLTHTRKSYSAVEIPYLESGRILLLDGIGEEVLAEAEAVRDEPVRFSVPPGVYIVYIVKQSGAVRVAETEVAPHQTTTLGPDDFSTTTLIQSVARGGLFRTPEYAWRHKVGGFAMWRTSPLEDVGTPWGVGIHYRLQAANGIQPTVRLFTTSAAHGKTGRAYHDVGVNVGIGYTFDVSFIALHLEVLMGYEHMFQDALSTDIPMTTRPHTSAFSGVGSMGIEVPLSFVYLFADVGAGGRVFQIVNRGWVPGFEFQALAGAGLSWGTR